MCYIGTTHVNEDVCEINYFAAVDKKYIVEWPAAHKLLEEWAKDQGCTIMTTRTRKGLIRRLEKIGWQFIKKQKAGYLMTKKLEV